jgi:hydroxyacylglutathione hydrolase
MKKILFTSAFMALSLFQPVSATPEQDQALKMMRSIISSLEAPVAPSLQCETPSSVPTDDESRRIAEHRWRSGAPDCDRPESKLPPYEVLQVNEGYFILRQNKCVNFEAPFIYLVMGTDGAMLFDSGATEDPSEFPLRAWVDSILPATNSRGEPYQLTIAHSHSHGDHTAGDSQFANRPNTRVIGESPEEVARAFNISNWPQGNGELDLGDRKLVILPIPGHEESSIAVYDPKSRDLLSGDTIYPGNIFLSEGTWPEFRGSMRRLHQFSQSNPIRNILGAHIEMSSTPKVDYEYGSTYQPEERRLPLYQGNLDEIFNYTESRPRPDSVIFDDLRLAL